MTRTCLAIAMLALCAVPASAQPLTFSRTDVASNTGARGIASADFDGNGWPDLATANTGRNSVTVLLNHVNGSAGFRRAYEVGVGTGPFDIVAADFDRDNIPDLAVANADDDTISVLFMKSGGTVASQLVLAASGNPRGITAGDMNGDGIPDIVYTTYLAKALRIVLSDGSGGFTQSASFTPDQSFPQGVAVADMNRDGAFDVIVAYTNHTGLAIWFGDGKGQFAGGGTTTGFVASINAVVAGDFNRDGKMDVAAASTTGNLVAVYLGVLTTTPDYRAYPVGSSPRGIAVADLNSDGTLDLVTANRASNGVSILLGRPSAPGTFSAATSVAAGAGSREVVVDDFDHDGLLDLATGNELASTATVLTNQIVLPPSAFAFNTESIPNASFIYGWDALAAGDFNRNGTMDIVIPGRIVFDGGASFTDLPGRGEGDYVVADFNRDGKLDIARTQAYEQPPQLQVFLGDGAGAFTLWWQQGFNIGVLSVADINRDGIPDLVASAFDAPTTIRTYLGDGTGNFTGGPTTVTGAHTSLFDLADVNGDGMLDVLWVIPDFTANNSQIIVALGNGTGAFGAPARHAVPSPYVGLARAADFNHDGIADIATDGIGEVFILIGTGGGSFAAPARFATTSVPAHSSSSYRFQIADLNSDGNLDLVFDSTLWGQGDGTFVPGNFDLPWAQKVFADVDHNGTLDIVASLYTSAELVKNLRTTTNHAPAITAIQDMTFSYVGMFENDPDDEFCGLCASAEDPDLHTLTFEWKDDGGRVVGYGPSLVPKTLAPGTYHLTLTVTDGRGGEVSRAMTLTITPFENIVTDGYRNCCGAWQVTEDSTAGEGYRMWMPDAGRPKVVTPLANPVDYFEIAFTADPSQTYKLWVRLKAQSNGTANDSMHLQFGGAVNAANGAAVAPIGTNQSLEIVLEECVGCGISGWGWRDERWGPTRGTAAPVMLRFPEGGRQVLRIQNREDGVSVDEVVLSSSTYKTTSPGTVKNDTHILGRTSYDY